MRKTVAQVVTLRIPQIQPIEFDLNEDAADLQRDLEDEVHERVLVQQAQGHVVSLEQEQQLRAEISARQQVMSSIGWGCCPGAGGVEQRGVKGITNLTMSVSRSSVG